MIMPCYYSKKKSAMADAIELCFVTHFQQGKWGNIMSPSREVGQKRVSHAQSVRVLRAAQTVGPTICKGSLSNTNPKVFQFVLWTDPPGARALAPVVKLVK